MRTYKLFVAFIVPFLSSYFVIAQPHIQRTGVNLVSNPDMDNTTGWSLTDGALYDSSISRDTGTGSVKMDQTGCFLRSTAFPVIPGKTYTLAFYIRSNSFPPPVISLYIGYQDSSQTFVRNSIVVRQSISATDTWQECVALFRPQAGEVYAYVKCKLTNQAIGYTGTVWLDNFYFGEGVGFEQAPTAKSSFSGSVTRVDELGNVEVYKNGEWTPFFPISICGDTDRTDWTDYSNQGFNAEARAGDYTVVQKALAAGMMAGFDISPYITPENRKTLTTLITRINELKNNSLMNNVLWYYWDNENCYDEWDVPLAVTNKVKELDLDISGNRMHPIYSLEGNEGLARKYNNSNVNMIDIVGDYVTKDIGGFLPDATRGALGILTLWNVEQQKNPVVVAQINDGVGMRFRPRVFNAIANGAKGISFWRDDVDSIKSIPVENQPWWSDLPNISSEINQLLPIIRTPHWTDWSLSSNNSLINFGTRDYQGEGYIIVTNEQSSAQTVTFTISNLPYTPVAVKDFFSCEVESSIENNQFTLTIPSYGSKVCVLEGNIEETLTLNLTCNETGTTAYDSSYFCNDGNLLNGAVFSNGIITFDGIDDRVNCDNDSSLDIGKQDITLFAQVKLKAVQNTYAGIITKGGGSDTDKGYALTYRADYSGGTLTFALSNGTSRLRISSQGNLGIHNNTWHTVAVSVDRNGNASFYVDGVSKGGGNISSFSGNDIVNTSRDLLVGSWVNSHHLKGDIDNVRIYKKALSAQEIVDLDENIILVLGMEFNDPSGNPYDSSIYCNDGILTGEAVVSNGSLILDGIGDYVDSVTSSSLEIGTNDLSIIAKVKLAVNQNTYAGIITKGGGSDIDEGYALIYRAEYSGGILTFALSNGFSRLWISSQGNLDLHDNAWHTLGVSVDRDGDVIFYVDGSEKGSGCISSFSEENINNSSRDLLIGSWINNHFLQGEVDYVLMYKRKLSNEEMTGQ